MRWQQARALDRKGGQGGRSARCTASRSRIKDIFDTEDYPTECGSPILAGRQPDADATAVRKLRDAGAVIIGKTVTTEFAYFHPGKTRNPHDPNARRAARRPARPRRSPPAWCRSPSARRPTARSSAPARSAACSRVKPSHGVMSRAGALTLSRTLDHVGAFARSLDDLALMLDVIAGYDPPIPTRGPMRAPQFSRSSRPKIRRCRRALLSCARRCGTRPTRRRARRLRSWPRSSDAREVDLPESYAPPGMRSARSWPPKWRTISARCVDKGGEVSKRSATDRRRPQGYCDALSGRAARARAARRDRWKSSSRFRRHHHAVGAGRRAERHRHTGDPVFCTLVDTDRASGAQSAAH